MADHCYFDTSGAVCSKHASEVCGVCCSDYYLFNKMSGADQINDDELNKIIKNYFKKPQKISRHGSKRMFNPAMHSLLNSTISSQVVNLIEMVTLCGFICFSARFVPQNQDRVVGILKFALYAYSERNKDSPLNEMKQAQKEIKEDIKKRKKKRKQTVKQKQAKKQKKFKKKGIQRRMKREKPSFSDKLNNGEVDVYSPFLSMLTLLTENGCVSFGPFFQKFEETFADNDFEQKLNELRMTALKLENPDDEIHLNDAQRATLSVAKTRMEFAGKYGNRIPIDDPKRWSERKIVQFLKEHDILPRPQPKKIVLIRVVEEFIKIKSILLQQMCSGLDEFDNAENKNDDAYNDENDEPNIVVDAQTLIPLNCHPFSMECWDKGIELSQFFALGKLHATTKPFKDICDSFIVIASRIDKCDSVDDIPIFIVQDAANTMALTMRVVGITFNQSAPMVVVIYHFGVRGTTDPMEIMCEMTKGRLMQSVPADVREIKLMTRLLKKNRGKLSAEFVENVEKKCGKGWRWSVFVPFQKEEKKCPSCNKLATLRCSRCKNVCYCSQQCQKLHWKKHKKVCKDTTTK